MLLFFTFFLSNHSVSLYFDVRLVNPLSTNTIQVPYSTSYSQFCSKVVINPVITYNQYWDVFVSGYYTANSNQFETLRTVLLNVWRNKLSYLGVSYSLYVDIFKNRIEYLSAPGLELEFEFLNHNNTKFLNFNFQY